MVAHILQDFVDYAPAQTFQQARLWHTLKIRALPPGKPHAPIDTDGASRADPPGRLSGPGAAYRPSLASPPGRTGPCPADCRGLSLPGAGVARLRGFGPRQPVPGQPGTAVAHSAGTGLYRPARR